MKEPYHSIPYFDVNIVLWLNSSPIEPVDMSRQWNQEGKVLVSERHYVIVIEQGWKVRYDVQLRPRHNVPNTPSGLAKIVKHAKTLPGARAINFYNPNKKKGKNFCYRENIHL